MKTELDSNMSGCAALRRLCCAESTSAGERPPAWRGSGMQSEVDSNMSVISYCMMPECTALTRLCCARGTNNSRQSLLPCQHQQLN
jgi:hypothetical protein